MNAYCDTPSNELEHTVSFRRPSVAMPTSKRARHGGFGKRRGKAPQQFNGIHRRRKKKISW